MIFFFIYLFFFLKKNKNHCSWSRFGWQIPPQSKRWICCLCHLSSHSWRLQKKSMQLTENTVTTVTVISLGTVSSHFLGSFCTSTRAHPWTYEPALLRSNGNHRYNWRSLWLRPNTDKFLDIWNNNHVSRGRTQTGMWFPSLKQLKYPSHIPWSCLCCKAMYR